MQELAPILATAIPAIIAYLVAVEVRMKKENRALRKENLELAQQNAFLKGTLKAIEEREKAEKKRRPRS